MKFLLNGQSRTYDGDPERPLLHYLREAEGIISPKDGCAPQAACGCCAVELNGKAVLSCVITMAKVEGGEVTTIEGLSEVEQARFANAFLEKGGVQCGFCIPGIVMQAKVLIDHHPDPTRQEVQKALTPHLCRCTGYKKIEDAILYAAESAREDKTIPAPSDNGGGVGARLAKYDSYNVVLGRRPYVDDMRLPGLRYGALKFSDHPRARVQRIDTQAAAQLPGVLRVFTAADIPGERYTGLIVQDWPVMVAEGEETRYIGDVLAAVVAESEEIARQATALIEVDYEVLPPLSDMHQALQPGAPQIHPRGNLLSETVIRRGEVDKALTEATYVSRGTYETQTIEHGYMEPECCVARPAGKGVEVFSQGQGIYEDQKALARILNLPLDDVTVRLVPNGGGFGGKEDLSVQGHAALHALLLQQPVKIRLTRDESIRMHPKRHPLHMVYELACDKAGRLTALKADILGDTGAYASVGMKVLERAAGHATGAYFVPNVDVVSRAVYTNNIPNGAMRGFGVNQVTFAVESCIDDLCEQGGFDRWQFRYDNALTEGKQTSTGQILRGGVGVRQTLEAVKEPFYAAKYAGLGCGIKNTGIGNGMPDAGTVRIEVQSSQKVLVHHGWTEMGQGVNTMAVQFLCQESGLDPAIVEVRTETSAKTPAGMTTASRATSLLGNAIINAAAKLRRDLQDHPLAALEGRVYEGEWVCDWTTKPGKEGGPVETHYSYSYATQLVTLDEDGKIDMVYAAHDAGRIINPTLFEGQIQGSVHMGLGYAVSEELVYQNGLPVSTRLRKCGILRAKETPEIRVIGVEVPDPHGPYGAKGVGEIGLVPTAAAVANALYQFDRVRRFSLPMRIKPRRRG